ncbi:MAG: PEP-utilizing enzyme [bacterium]|nr:PEP-utilizing enzyme [bacterium]
MTDGDILVARQTTPDLLGAMKKSIAIITEEGGLLCHAAIVSRELKLPCIVGVKKATSKLKDGTKVDVDANNGIVKILK